MKTELKVLYLIAAWLIVGVSIAQTSKTIPNRALDGDLKLQVNDGGVPTDAMEIDGSTADVNIDNTTLYIDASTNRVGVGTAGPSYNLHLFGTGDTPLAIESTGNRAQLFMFGNRTGSDGEFAEFGFTNNGDSLTSIQMFREGADDAGAIAFGTQPTGGGITERVRIGSDGVTTFTEDVNLSKASGNANLTVDGNINATSGTVRILHQSGTIANGASLPDLEVGSSGLLYSGTIHAYCMQSGDINDQTYRMYHTSGRGNTALFTIVDEHLRSSGCSFTVSRPIDRFARLTNTSGVSCACAIAYFGVTT